VDGNILSGGIDILHSIKEKVIELNNNREKRENLLVAETKLEKAIQNKEKALADEIVSTTKKRKEEIESTFNSQIDSVRSRMKKIRGKKEKSKSAKIKERIVLETADLRQEQKQMVKESKDIFKQERIPFFCNSRLFYALYMPKGIGDFFIICLTLLITLLGIPSLIYFVILPEEKLIYLLIIYLLTVILFGLPYMLIENNIKDKHIEAIRKVRTIRSDILVNKKKQNKIKKKILKDQDESQYGLDKFNNELQESEKEISSIAEKKQEALTLFENTTRFVIGEEIKLRYQEEIKTLKQEYDSTYNEIRMLEENIKNMTMELSSDYEVYLGKEFMSAERLDKLAELMSANNLSTISEAITLYSQERQ
jgi:hypothetical protein